MLISRRRLAVVFLFFCWASSGPAAAATWDQLCGGATGDGQFPTDSEIIRAAEIADLGLDRVDDPAGFQSVLAALDLPASSSTRPSAGALGRYCTTVGEVMRLSVDGSQFQAQTYLIAAYRQALAANDPIASRAAYQFGLVSMSGAAAVGMRGTRGARRGGSDFVVAEARQAEQVEDGACSALADADLQYTSNAYLSTLALQCAADRSMESGDRGLAARAGLRLSRFRLAWSETAASDADALRQEALDTALSTLPVAASLPASELRSELLGRLVSTALDAGAEESGPLRAAVAAMREGPVELVETAGLAAALEARLAMLDGDLETARTWAEQAVLLESRRSLPARLPEFFLLLGQADPAHRRRHVFAAYTALGNIRPLLPRRDPLTEETSFSLYMRRVFESAADIQLAGASGEMEGSQVRAAQEIIEAFRQAELQSAVGSECLPPREPLRTEDLRPGEIVLYPLLLPDRVELLYVAGADVAQGDARFRRLAPDRSANRQLVTRLVEQLVLSMSYDENDAWQEPARQLYRILIAPIEDRIEPGGMLAIIPDGPLRALPFGTLIAPDGDLLIRRTRLGVAPALAYLQAGAPQQEGSLHIVATSLQREMVLPAGAFPELSGTTEEARIAAASGHPGVQIADFRKSDLETALAGGDVDVLHLATHAAFNGRADRAFIVANGEVIRLAELREMIARNRTRGDELDLLVLSACETAVGDDEASMGLAGATVQAGALSAIASLWQVDDVGTAELMRLFYQHYAAGRSRSEALREAQLALIDAGGDNGRPRVWAAFALLGAWR